jgi:hypothetical protein
MALVLADRVKETTTTTGTGTITLAGASTGYQSFSAVGNGNTTYYSIVGQGNSEWEVGIGTYTSSGTTLSRDTVLSSSAGGTTKTNFSAGTKDVFVTYPSSKSAYFDGTSLVFKDNTSQPTAATGFGFKNRIINGAMVIDQRNAGASVTPTNGQYLVDRFYALVTAASKFTAQRDVGLNNYFANSLKITSSSAYSLAAGDVFSIIQKIEGNNTVDFGFGTANAQSITLSFLVNSSLTGTFGGSLMNASLNRSYPFTFSIPTANTATSISVTIPGDTSGTWGTGTGTGFLVSFSMGTGTTFSGTAGAWGSSEKYSATGAVSVVSTSGATFYITGVQLEKGSTATSFDYRPYGTELALCQRYFEKSQPQGSAVAGGTAEYFFVGSNFRGSSLLMRYPLKWAVTKRASPTVTYFNPRPGGTAGQITTASADYSGTTAANTLDSGTEVQGTTNSGGASGDAAYVNWTASSEL